MALFPPLGLEPQKQRCLGSGGTWKIISLIVSRLWYESPADLVSIWFPGPPRWKPLLSSTFFPAVVQLLLKSSPIGLPQKWRSCLIHSVSLLPKLCSRLVTDAVACLTSLFIQQAFIRHIWSARHCHRSWGCTQSSACSTLYTGGQNSLCIQYMNLRMANLQIPWRQLCVL